MGPQLRLEDSPGHNRPGQARLPPRDFDQNRQKQSDSLFAHAAVLDVLGDLVVDGGGQRQVEEAVRVGSAGQRRDVSVEFAEGSLVVVLPTDVGVPLEERRQPLRLSLRRLRQTAFYFFLFYFIFFAL